jgi:predicted nucleic acid-binding protein
VTNFFVDTSALAKRYLKEPGSAWVLSWIEPPAGNITVISQLTLIEMFAVLARSQRTGLLTLAAASALQNDFLVHIEKEYLVIGLDDSVVLSARSLVLKHPLRTLDAIQLASAMQAVLSLGEPITFISGDSNLLNAALAEGFTTDNPYSHP